MNIFQNMLLLCEHRIENFSFRRTLNITVSFPRKALKFFEQ